MSESKEFRRSIYIILLSGLAIIGLIEIQRMEYEHRASDERLAIAKRSGEVSIQGQAARAGYGRYEGTNFVWNTNLFNHLDIAMDSVIRSEIRTARVADACLKMAQVTIEAGQVMQALNVDDE